MVAQNGHFINENGQVDPDLDTSGSQEQQHILASGIKRPKSAKQQAQMLEAMRLAQYQPQQALLRAALIRERNARIAELNHRAALMRAHPMDAAVIPKRASLVN